MPSGRSDDEGQHVNGHDTWGDSDGVKERCDGNCHKAVTSSCNCMCGGRFHGRALGPGGMDQAIRELCEKAPQAAAERAAGEGLAVKVEGCEHLQSETLQLDFFSNANPQRAPKGARIP